MSGKNINDAMRRKFDEAIRRLEDTGLRPFPEPLRVRVPGGGLEEGLRYVLGPAARILPEYGAVRSWLEDNRGRGLLCYGACGRGKTILCGRVIPLLLNIHLGKVTACYDATRMNAVPDEVLSRRIVFVDDIGTEGPSVIYGERRMVLPELADAAEKEGKTLLLTTNLTLPELAAKYGARTADRLRAVTLAVPFSGESLRK